MDGSRLRLRRERTGDQDPSVWKLTKKYGEPSDYAQAITNIYLEPAEWTLLRSLPGRPVTKRRYNIPGASELKLDVFENDLAGLTIAEFEHLSLEVVRDFAPPPWVGEEITGRREWSGGSLAITGAPRV